MDYSKLTDEELSSLPPELLQEVLVEIESQNARNGKASEVDQSIQHSPQTKPSGYANTEISNSMHPKFGEWDRWVVKNLASSPDAGIGYMQKEYPSMEFRKTRDGEIVGKYPEDPYFYRLDEKDTTWKDIPDIAFDAAQGLAEGIGATKAGVISMNPAPAIATAGAIGLASETAKQSLGSMMGIPNNFNSGNRAFSAGASMLMPVIGKGLKSAWAATKEYAPKIMSTLSNYPEDVIRNINVDQDARKKISNIGPDAYAQNVVEELSKGLGNTKKNLSSNVGNTVEGPVNILEIKNKINKSLELLPESERPKYSQAYDVIAGAADEVPAIDAFRYKNELHKLGQKGSTPSIVKSVATESSEMMRNALKNKAPDKSKFEDAMAAYNKFLDTTGRETFKPFKKQYSDRPLDSFSGWYNGKRGEDALLSEARDRLSQNIHGYSGVDLDKTARELNSHKLFSPQNSSWTNEDTRLLKWAPQIGTGVGYGLAALGSGTMFGIGPLIGATAGALAGKAAKTATSTNAIKAGAAMSPWIESIGDGSAKYLYNNPYMRTDKALINLRQNENRR